MAPDGTTTITQSPEDLRAKVKEQVVDGQPAFFKLEAQLPRRGVRTPVAASDKMWVVLKTYAADSENGLHAHPNEDHTFVVLQGEATFYGPNDEVRTIGRNEGVLLPHGTFYWFKATSEEPLVMIRIGAAAFDGSTATAASPRTAARCAGKLGREQRGRAGHVGALVPLSRGHEPACRTPIAID